MAPEYVSITCVECGSVEPTKATIDQHRAWLNGQYIQIAMRNLTPDERECFIMRMCSKCVDNLYASLGPED